MSNKRRPPVVPLDVDDTDETREPTGENLRYNEDADSFELDAETSDEEYQHPNPYDTATAHGGDAMATYDEANPHTVDEYETDSGKSEELDGEFIGGTQNELDEIDEKFTEASEEQPGEVDEEGYPKRDDTGGQNNPIVSDSDDSIR